MSVKLYLGDCLEIMKSIPDKSVDAVITDPPYGTTNISWDKPIDLQEFWKQTLRIVKDSAPIIIFSSQPFTTDLINSNRKIFRYEIIWNKTQAQGFLNANRAPLRAHENIVVFYRKQPVYVPQKTRINRNDLGREKKENPMRSKQYREMNRTVYFENGTRYPMDVINFSNWNGALFGNIEKSTKHPTQKPEDLMRYLTLTYSNIDYVLLDPFMGSGTTGVACVQTGRNFIGIEIDPGYFKIAEKRIHDAEMQMRLPI